MSDIEELWAGPTGKWDPEAKEIYTELRARFEARLSGRAADCGLSGDKQEHGA